MCVFDINDEITNGTYMEYPNEEAKMLYGEENGLIALYAFLIEQHEKNKQILANSFKSFKKDNKK